MIKELSLTKGAEFFSVCRKNYSDNQEISQNIKTTMKEQNPPLRGEFTPSKPLAGCSRFEAQEKFLKDLQELPALFVMVDWCKVSSNFTVLFTYTFF